MGRWVDYLSEDYELGLLGGNGKHSVKHTQSDSVNFVALMPSDLASSSITRPLRGLSSHSVAIAEDADT